MQPDYLPKLRSMCPDSCQECSICEAVRQIEYFRQLDAERHAKAQIVRVGNTSPQQEVQHAGSG